MSSMADPSTRTYYAHKRTGKVTGTMFYLHASPNKWWVEIHMMDDPIVEIRLRERTESDLPSSYWGWLDTRHPDEYTMVGPSEVQLNMCFSYGPEAAEAHGDGRKVNLVVEEIPPGA